MKVDEAKTFEELFSAIPTVTGKEIIEASKKLKLKDLGTALATDIYTQHPNITGEDLGSYVKGKLDFLKTR